MLGAGELVLELRHFLFGAVQDAAKLVRQTKIDTRAGDFRFAIQLSEQLIAELIWLNADFFEQRLGDALALIEQSGQKMFVRDFLMIELRSDILRGLQRFLHLLRKFIDAHPSKSDRASVHDCLHECVFR